MDNDKAGRIVTNGIKHLLHDTYHIIDKSPIGTKDVNGFLKNKVMKK